MLYVFIVLRHDRRRVVHFNATTNPHAEWTAQQIINAFPYEEAPRFLIRDRDDIYSDYFTRRVEGMGLSRRLWLRGFSTYTCLHASQARIAAGACQWSGVAITMASTDLSSSTRRMSGTACFASANTNPSARAARLAVVIGQRWDQPRLGVGQLQDFIFSDSTCASSRASPAPPRKGAPGSRQASEFPRKTCGAERP